MEQAHTTAQPTSAPIRSLVVAGLQATPIINHRAGACQLLNLAKIISLAPPVIR